MNLLRIARDVHQNLSWKLVFGRGKAGRPYSCPWWVDPIVFRLPTCKVAAWMFLAAIKVNTMAKDDHKPSLEEARDHILRKIREGQRADEERTRYTWREIRDDVFCLYVSICVFAATAYGISDVLKLPLFADLFNRDGYWSAYGLGGLIGAAAWTYTVLFFNRVLRSG
jgi:hypothetical protein